MRLRPLLLLGLLLVGLRDVRAADDAFVAEHLNGLSGSAVLEIAKELASDEMKGRKTAFEGGSLVENWMLGKMSEFGLHPADAAGTYLEPFTFGACNTESPIALAVGGTSLVYGQDFFDLTYTGSGNVEAEAVFVGYGIERPDVAWDDYAGLDVKGKIVVAIRGVPAARASEFQEERYIGYKSSKAAEKGAVGFLLVQEAKASTGTIQERFHRGTLPALWLSGAVADRLLASKKTTLAELKAARDGGSWGQGFATGMRVAMEVHARFVPNAKGHNALGAIPGRDPDLVEEVILVGAHMDHLGVGPDGQVFNGADDNASGTAVLIHLADLLTSNRLRPKRTIVFCAFGAEEQGLFGSKALAARYPFDGRVVCVLNMDMVGQGEPVVRIDGTGAYPRMGARLRAFLGKDLAGRVEFPPRTGSASDHWPFHERGVPAFGISTKGEHPNYHAPQDDAANLDPACLEVAARAVGTLLVRLAMHAEPLLEPDGLTDYILHEGPRFSAHPLADTGLPHGPFAQTLRTSGVTCLLAHVADDRDPAATWALLEAQEKEDDAPWRLVRQVSDIQKALREGRIGVLPVLECRADAAADAGAIGRLAGLGYRVLEPWRGVGEKLAAPLAVAAACRAAKVLVGLRGLPAPRWGEARAALGDWPALLAPGDPALFTSELMEHGAAAGRETLLLHPTLGAALRNPYGLGPALHVGPDEAALQAELRAWAPLQSAGWELPGSDARKTLREVLGGRLVAWWARAQR